MIKFLYSFFLFNVLILNTFAFFKRNDINTLFISIFLVCSTKIIFKFEFKILNNLSLFSIFLTLIKERLFIIKTLLSLNISIVVISSMKSL